MKCYDEDEDVDVFFFVFFFVVVTLMQTRKRSYLTFGSDNNH